MQFSNIFHCVQMCLLLLAGIVKEEDDIELVRNGDLIRIEHFP